MKSIRVKKQITLIIFYLLIFLINSSNIFPFQKVVWAFWNSQIHEAPLVVQLCHQKIQRISRVNGYKFIYLHTHNLRYYISNYESQFLKVLTKSQRKSSQADSDLIRISIVQEHGGIYFDLSTILFNDYGLQWLQNLDNYNNLLINKYSSNPDVLLFTYCNYQSSLNQRSKNNFLINQNPGFQIWFIAAKKNAQLMKDWKRNYYNFTQRGFYSYNKLLSDQNIFIKNVDIGGSYWSANLALYYTFQIKQHQLDKQITLNSLFLPRQSVYEYYKTWGIQGQHGPLVFTRNNVIKQENIFQQTLQQLQSRTGELKFFLKMNSIFRKPINHDLIQLSKLYKYGNFDFDDYLKNQPYSEDCHRVKFITEGSLIDKQFISNSNIAKQLKITPITLIQRQKWRNYCSQYMKIQQQQFNFYQFLSNEFPIGQYARIEQIQNWKQNQTLSEMINNLFKYNTFIQWYIGYFIIFVSICLTIIVLSYNITYKIFEESIGQFSMRVNQHQAIRMSQMNPEIERQNNMRNYLNILLVLIQFSELIFGMLIFYQLQVFNYIPKIQLTIFYILFSILIDNSFKSNLLNSQPYYYLNIPLSKIVVLFDLPINYFMCYSILSTIENRAEYIIFHSIIIVLIGSSMYRLALKLAQDKKNNVNIGMKMFMKHQGCHKKIVLLIYSIIMIVPNIKYYMIGNVYMLQYFLYIPLIYVALLFISMFYELSKQKMKHQTYLKTKILFIILLSASLLSFLVFYKILYVKTWQIQKYYLSLISAFTYIYILCNGSINTSRFKKNNQNKIGKEDILLYGSIVYYLVIGTYCFSYDILEIVSSIQTMLFLGNIGFYLSFQQIFIAKKQSIYEKIDKNEQIQTSSFPI